MTHEAMKVTMKVTVEFGMSSVRSSGEVEGGESRGHGENRKGVLVATVALLVTFMLTLCVHTGLTLHVMLTLLQGRKTT